jgi:hypothetical protein
MKVFSLFLVNNNKNQNWCLLQVYAPLQNYFQSMSQTRWLHILAKIWDFSYYNWCAVVPHCGSAFSFLFHNPLMTKDSIWPSFFPTEVTKQPPLLNTGMPLSPTSQHFLTTHLYSNDFLSHTTGNVYAIYSYNISQLMNIVLISRQLIPSLTC